MFFTSSYLHMLKRVEDTWEEEDYYDEHIESKLSSSSLQSSKKSRKFLQILKGAKEKLHKKIQDSDESGNFSEASGYFGDDEVENCKIRFGESTEYDFVNSVKVAQLQKRPQSLAVKHNRRRPKSHSSQTSPFALEEYLIIETPDDFAYNLNGTQTHSNNQSENISCHNSKASSDETDMSPENTKWVIGQGNGVHLLPELREEKALMESPCQEVCKECHQSVQGSNHKSTGILSESIPSLKVDSEWRGDVLLQLQSFNQRIREQFSKYESCFFEKCQCSCHGRKNGGYVDEYNSVLKYVRSHLDLPEAGVEFSLTFPSYDSGTLQVINQNRRENLLRATTIFRKFSFKDCKGYAEREASSPVKLTDNSILWWRENVLEQLKVRNYWESKSFCDKEIVEHQKMQAHPELEEFCVISDCEDLSTDTLSLGVL